MLNKAFKLILILTLLTQLNAGFVIAQELPFSDNPEVENIQDKIKEKQQTIENLKKAAN